MPYIGHSPTNAGSFVELDDIASGFNGSGDAGSDVTAFTMQVGGVSVTPSIENLLIILDGVVQQPTNAFSISGSTLTFTEAPQSGTDFYGILMGQSATVGQGTITASEMAVTGNGSSGQLLKSDGDGTFTWIDQSTVTAPASGLVGNTLASGVVSSSLTTVGTIGTGTWEGTKIASAYLDDDTAHLSGSTFTGALIVDPSSAVTSKISSYPDYNFEFTGGDQFNVRRDNGNAGQMHINYTGGNVQFGQVTGNAHIMDNVQESAPAYAFKGDTNTGMGRVDSDKIGFFTNGSSKMTIASDGTSTFSGQLVQEGDTGEGAWAATFKNTNGTRAGGVLIDTTFSNSSINEPLFRVSMAGTSIFNVSCNNTATFAGNVIAPGSVIQVTQSTSDGAFNTDSTSWVHVTPLEGSITTKQTNSKILITMCNTTQLSQANDVRYVIGIKWSGNSYGDSIFEQAIVIESNWHQLGNNVTYLHSPNVSAGTTLTYKMYCKKHSGTGSLYMPDRWGVHTSGVPSSSTILQEIGV